MKKALKIIGIVCLAVTVLMIAAVLIIPALDLPEGDVNIEVGEIDLRSIQDGSYSGDYTAGLVSVSLTVKVADHKITDINIDKHENGLGKKAEKIADDIVAAQSLDVDAVSGATISSDVIRKAVEVAVNSK